MHSATPKLGLQQATLKDYFLLSKTQSCLNSIIYGLNTNQALKTNCNRYYCLGEV